MTNKITQNYGVTGIDVDVLSEIMGEAFASAISQSFALQKPDHQQKPYDTEQSQREGLYGKGHFGHCFGHAALPELLERHRRLTASMEKLTKSLNGPRQGIVGAPANLQTTTQNTLNESSKQLMELESLINQLYGAGGLTYAKIQSLPGYANWPEEDGVQD